MIGYGRKQPTRFERLQLFILYASVWYLAYAMSLRRRGRPCRKAWVETCVPTHLGGNCDGTVGMNCATDAILAAVPDKFNDFEAVKSRTSHGIDLHSAKCVKAGHSPCEIPMCMATAGSTCVDKPDGTGGFCRCESTAGLILFDTILYTFLFKLLYMPFWYLFVADIRKKCGCCADCCITLSVLPLYLIITIVAVAILRDYMNSDEGFVWETLWWFITFCFLCCFEVVKALTLGFVVGSYVIRPVLGRCAGAVWQFLLA